MQQLSNLDLALHHLKMCSSSEKETALAFLNDTFLEDIKKTTSYNIPTVRQIMDQLIKKHNYSIKTGRTKRHKQNQGKSLRAIS